MRNTWGVIADFVSVAGSLEEAKKLVAEEIAKGDCVSTPERLIDERIESLWQAKVKASVPV